MSLFKFSSPASVYRIGVDGGGTSCRCRLTDAGGVILGEGFSGSANPRVGLEEAWGNILSACKQAIAQANLSTEIYKDTILGLCLAGVAQEREQSLVLSYPHPFQDVYLFTDAHAACLGAFSGNDGGILILGTGSCGLSYQMGVFKLFGGWGFPVSDQGSGAQIGLDALRYSLLSLDGIVPKTDFTQAVMKFFDYKQQRVVQWLDQAKPRDYARFAPLVFSHADINEPIARDILRDTAKDIDVMLAAMRNHDVKQYSLMGGVSHPITLWLSDESRKHLITPTGDALDGALLMAKRKLGIQLDQFQSVS